MQIERERIKVTVTIRPAKFSDLDQITTLLLADAEDRHAADPRLWRLDNDARNKTASTIRAAMEAEKPPFRQQWLVAEAAGKLIGVTHSILLPVPPIYAGEFGPPGLIMEDCYIVPDAPAKTRGELLKAAEVDLIEAGAVILLASSVEGGSWENEYVSLGYEALTMYFAKTSLTQERAFSAVRHATEEDVPAIVASSAVHRRVLADLHHLFWKPHDNADNRFGSWMQRSLTLKDRDIFVAGAENRLQGYGISQPATPLHFPTPHDISGVGVIDDFYHSALENPQNLGPNSSGAASLLLRAAEAAREQRGDHSVLVVCPAAWQSKIILLEQAGYHNAISWHIKIAY